MLSPITLRAPEERDIPILIELTAAAGAELGSARRATEEDIRKSWATPGFDPRIHARVAELDGRVVGEAHIWLERRPRAELGGFTSPEARGRGVGTELLAWALETARATPGIDRVFAVSAAHLTDRTALIRSIAPFEHVRSFFRMTNRDPRATEPPSWPGGIRLKHLDGEELARAAKAANDGAFIDHWDFVPSSLDHWRHDVEDPSTDTSTWYLAVDSDDEPVGLCINRIDDSGPVLRARLGPIGTTRKARGIGLGRALLRHSLLQLAERGVEEVSLGVDTANPTGAVSLYEKNGFSREFEGLIYALDL